MDTVNCFGEGGHRDLSELYLEFTMGLVARSKLQHRLVLGRENLRQTEWGPHSQSEHGCREVTPAHPGAPVKFSTATTDGDRSVIPKMTKRAIVTDAAPGISSRTPSGERPAGITNGVSARIMKATGTLIKNAQRQLSAPTSIPPAIAPNVKPPESRAPLQPSARAHVALDR
jgi:hypothetical protein